MQEREVTIAGQHRRLGPPFHVLATQNPIEQEGTYPLPEAQLDRFLVQVDVTYPTRAAERDILMATTGAHHAQAKAALSAADLIAAQALIRRMPIGDLVVEAILDLVRACRPSEDEGQALQGTLGWGPGPRAAQSLMLMVRARALLQGRLAPTIADVRALAQPVLGHRMALTFAARARGESLADVIATVCDRILPA
jgi:MoxR-like ATPase